MHLLHQQLEHNQGQMVSVSCQDLSFEVYISEYIRINPLHLVLLISSHIRRDYMSLESLYHLLKLHLQDPVVGAQATATTFFIIAFITGELTCFEDFGQRHSH